MKQVLILTDQYPPFFAPRMAAVSKYLPLYGWQPTVVTGISRNTNANIHHVAEDSAMSDPCVVYRVPLDEHDTKVGHYIAFVAELIGECRDRQFGRKVRKLNLPKPDAILCFAYRKFPLRTAADLARYWQIPWVADCRDIVEQYPPGGFLPQKIKIAGRPLYGLMEQMKRRIVFVRNRYLSQASSVITVSPWHRGVLQRVNPDTELIYNGYDPELFVPEHPQTDCFRIVYAGRIVSLEARDPSPLFEALRHPALESMVSSGRLRVDWYIDEYSRQLIEPIASRYVLQDICYYHKMVALPALPQKLKEAAILLQLAASETEIGSHSYVTTKIFESMAMQKPILVVRSDHAILAEICTHAGMGCLADNVSQIVAYIAKQYRQWEENAYTIEKPLAPDYVASFSRREQTRAFAHILDKVVRNSGCTDVMKQ